MTEMDALLRSCVFLLRFFPVGWDGLLLGVVVERSWGEMVVKWVWFAVAEGDTRV